MASIHRAESLSLFLPICSLQSSLGYKKRFQCPFLHQNMDLKGFHGFVVNQCYLPLIKFYHSAFFRHFYTLSRNFLLEHADPMIACPNSWNFVSLCENFWSSFFKSHCSLSEMMLSLVIWKYCLNIELAAIRTLRWKALPAFTTTQSSSKKVSLTAVSREYNGDAFGEENPHARVQFFDYKKQTACFKTSMKLYKSCLQLSSYFLGIVRATCILSSKSHTCDEDTGIFIGCIFDETGKRYVLNEFNHSVKDCFADSYGICDVDSSSSPKFYHTQSMAFSDISDPLLVDFRLHDIDCLFDIGKIIGEGSQCVIRSCTYKNAPWPSPVYCLRQTATKDISISLFRKFAALCHPNIVQQFQLYNDCSADNQYILMEYGEGPDLFHYISQHPYRLPISVIRGIFAQVLKSLVYMHERELIHRDIKLENYVLKEKGISGNVCGDQSIPSIMLVDFGLAIQSTDQRGPVGTMSYMAPELFLVDNYDAKVDVWATGILLCFLLTGCSPFGCSGINCYIPASFPFQTSTASLYASMQCNFEKDIENWLALQQPGISLEIRQLVKHLLTADPSARLCASEALRSPWFQQPMVDIPSSKEYALCHVDADELIEQNMEGIVQPCLSQGEMEETGGIKTAGDLFERSCSQVQGNSCFLGNVSDYSTMESYIINLRTHSFT
ncbi:hypothetical protein IE077_000840 [Cardiosporidium cionae]|uniref:Protein kinase domain-containing protein n=1 Tax=Cardiosporidium cionae TaxID=476202 RepID=A0ABQ7JDU2_9APIC|nr:hypothetical protein IE077_000840 [Cardiosporidium cionae]|eukprot:KAF8822187.1 hypothetical protein IE077_000840 [Cardiosporidium cionae]